VNRFVDIMFDKSGFYILYFDMVRNPLMFRGPNWTEICNLVQMLMFTWMKLS